MALFKVVYSGRRLTSKRVESAVHRFIPVPDPALVKKYPVVTILRDSEGEDHPDNAGKFFLHRIVK